MLVQGGRCFKIKILPFIIYLCYIFIVADTDGNVKYDIVELDSVVFFNVSTGGVDVNYLFFKTIIIKSK